MNLDREMEEEGRVTLGGWEEVRYEGPLSHPIQEEHQDKGSTLLIPTVLKWAPDSALSFPRPEWGAGPEMGLRNVEFLVEHATVIYAGARD